MKTEGEDSLAVLITYQTEITVYERVATAVI